MRDRDRERGGPLRPHVETLEGECVPSGIWFSGVIRTLLISDLDVSGLASGPRVAEHKAFVEVCLGELRIGGPRISSTGRPMSL